MTNVLSLHSRIYTVSMNNEQCCCLNMVASNTLFVSISNIAKNPMSPFVIPPPVVDDQQYAWFLAPTADGKRLMIILTVNNIGIANAEYLLTFPMMLMGFSYGSILLLPPTSLSKIPYLLHVQGAF